LATSARNRILQYSALFQNLKIRLRLL